MSYYDYRASLELSDASFYALVMAAMRRADSSNLDKLREAWPEVWRELDERYNAPGGLLEGETLRQAVSLELSDEQDRAEL